MAQETGIAPKAPAGNAKDDATRIVSAKLKLYQLEDRIEEAESFSREYRLIVEWCDRAYSYLFGFRPQDPKLRTKYLNHVKKARAYMTQLRTHRVPIPPEPIPQIQIYQHVPTYDLMVDEGDGEHSIGTVLEGDLDKFVRGWTERRREAYYHASLNMARQVRMEIRSVLSYWGLWSIDEAISVHQPRVTSKDLQRRIDNREMAETKATSEDDDDEDDDDDV